MRTEQEKKVKIVCPECGGSNFIETVSDVVCRKCGLVIDQRYSSDHFIDSDSTDWRKNRFGSPESRRSKNTYFSSFEVSPGESRAQFQRMWFAEKKLEYDAIEENKSRLLNILTKLGFSSNQKNQIMYELRKRYEAEKRAGNKVSNIFLLASALVIILSKNLNIPVSIRTVVDIFKSYGCKISSKAVRDYIITNNLTYTKSSTSVWVTKHMATLRSDLSIRGQIRQELQNVGNTLEITELDIDKILTSIELFAVKLSKIDAKSRRPSVLSVACIFLASEMIAEKINISLFNQAFLARTCKVSPATLRSHLLYLRNNIKK